MNFFRAQDQAKAATRWLVIVYLAATTLIVAGVSAIIAVATYNTGYGINTSIMGAAAAVTVFVIVGATLYKVSVLSGGGARVAEQMGGTRITNDTQDPLRRRLRNVVEEMSIASGVPVPDIYVLERESGINAFAAGFAPGDAAVAVTRGTLELLDRDELQGVIAHEFSHILNGDMRLNIRMMGVLFGIMVVGLIGRTILRGTHHGGVSFGRRGRNAGAVVVVGNSEEVQSSSIQGVPIEVPQAAVSGAVHGDLAMPVKVSPNDSIGGSAGLDPIAAHTGLGHAGEKLANRGKQAHVRRRVRSRRAADR